MRAQKPAPGFLSSRLPETALVPLFLTYILSDRELQHPHLPVMEGNTTLPSKGAKSFQFLFKDHVKY